MQHDHNAIRIIGYDRLSHHSGVREDPRPSRTTDENGLVHDGELQ